MGRRDRERREALTSGEGMVFRNPVARKVIALRARSGVIEELSKGTVDDQCNRLSHTVGTGTLPPSKLKAALMNKAPKEMDKAIREFKKKGKPITVETLTEEVRTNHAFQAMCKQAGLDIQWFEKLAQEKMSENGIRG